MIITGYKYYTENLAIDARKKCADFYGLPVSPEDTTIFWVDYQFASFDDPIFWYIVYHNSLDVILGEPSDFEVTFNNPIL